MDGDALDGDASGASGHVRKDGEGDRTDSAMDRHQRNAVQLARWSAVDDWVLGKMESGTRLQFVQFVHALQCLCDDMVRVGWGCGLPVLLIVQPCSVWPLMSLPWDLHPRVFRPT